jgi:osmotically-inducible protein OsmY
MGASGREKIDDGTITAQVNARLAQDKELSGIKIDVDTQNGVVTLSGPTPTASAKERAAEIAHHVKGVVSVNNQLTITSG